MSDLRVIKTKALIKGAFIELVEAKGFDNVTVKDICNKAMINRNTFYLHYLDKIDLLTKLANEVFVEQESTINLTGDIINTDNKERIIKALTNILNVINREIEFYRVILLDSNMSGYISHFESHLRHDFITKLNLDYEKNKIELDYIFYGISGVIKKWVIKDYSTIDELSLKLCDLLLSNHIFLQKEKA